MNVDHDELRGVLEMQRQMALEHRFTYLLGPIRIALRPRLIVASHLEQLRVYTEAVWKDCLLLEKMYLTQASN